jgi:hypothetical protein
LVHSPGFESLPLLLFTYLVMFSLVKFALFSLICLATLALAIPSPAGHPNDPRALIANANALVEGTVLPLSPLYPFYASLDFLFTTPD